MSFLLDTHVLLWAAGTPERLPSDGRGLIENPETELMFSPTSLWEIAIKSGLGRLDFGADPRFLRRGLLEYDYTEVAVIGAHAMVVDTPPPTHRGPSTAS